MRTDGHFGGRGCEIGETLKTPDMTGVLELPSAGFKTSVGNFTEIQTWGTCGKSKVALFMFANFVTNASGTPSQMRRDRAHGKKRNQTSKLKRTTLETKLESFIGKGNS